MNLDDKYYTEIGSNDIPTAQDISLGLVDEGSRVLEFGPALGVTTKYLSEIKKCDVSIVEIDKNYADSASHYASDVCVGDAEVLEWTKTFSGNKYDHILFMDILEHLRNPLELINAAKSFLNDNGSMIISVPNIAHSAIIMELFDNKFTYATNGLLDKTHIYHFAYKSILEMLKSAGLYIYYESAVVLSPSQTEFRRAYDDSTPFLAQAVLDKEYGEVYQFIMKVGLDPHLAKESELCIPNSSRPRFTSQLFLDFGEGFSEDNSLSADVDPKSLEVRFELNTAMMVKRIRFDPCGSCAIVRLVSSEVSCLSGATKSVNYISNNSIANNSDTFFFPNDGPFFDFEINSAITSAVFNCEYIAIGKVAEFQMHSVLSNVANENAQRLSLAQKRYNEIIVQRADAQKRAEQAQAEANHARSEVIQFQKQILRTQTETDQLKQETELAKGEAERFRKQAGELRSDVERLMIEVEQLRAEMVQAQLDLHQSRSATAEACAGEVQGWSCHAELQDQFNVVKAEAYASQCYIDSLRRSLSWRLTAPLRLVGDLIVRFFVLISTCLRPKRFNIRKLLIKIRWSTAGSSVYTYLIPSFAKKIINRKWRECEPLDENQSHPNAAFNLAVPFEPEEECSAIVSCPIVKAIAFYLPQFHPIKENDEWWGQGFTEWTNVTKAQPMFIGHEQPKFPGAMGYYDLRLPEVMRQQAQLAKRFGIHGFCFHHYDFSGRRVLETPVNNFLENSDIDINFCLCWANENWTRRWDGFDEDVLLSQNHSPSDDIRFIESLHTYFSDKRYIRFDGRPLFIVYKPEQFPDISATLQRWRAHWKRIHGEGLYIVMAQSFGAEDPRDLGFDAAVQFPPHKYSWDNPRLNSQLKTVDDYAGQIFDYEHFAQSYCEPDPEYVLYKTVSPAWDNTARRGVNGTVIANSSPSKYKKWLDAGCKWTISRHEKGNSFIFINAWNEWAEGAYLEPDRRYGYAFLNATSQVLADYPQDDPQNVLTTGTILFVSHDAHLGGAQKVLLSLLRWFSASTSLKIYILCLDGGPFLDEFTRYGTTITLRELELSLAPGLEFDEQVLAFCGGKPNLIYGNTVAAGAIYSELSILNVPIVTHVHELEESIQVYAKDYISGIIDNTSHYIACSPAVRDNLLARYGVEQAEIDLVCAHIDVIPDEPSDDRKHKLRTRLGLPVESKIVVGCGLGLFWRKGADLFVEVAREVVSRNAEDVVFYWVGDFDSDQTHEEYGSWEQVLGALRSLGFDQRVNFIGQKPNAVEYIEAADVLVLPSREDPFPLVCLEAAERSVPIVCFAEAGGMPSFVKDDCGAVVPWCDVKSMADSVVELLSRDELRAELGALARSKVLFRHTVDQAGPAVLDVIRKVGKIAPAVSVIVPNYNKDKYLQERLDSIFSQSYKDFEVIILDDCSTDNSRKVIDLYANRPSVSVFFNEKNSGVFSQWKKGIKQAASDLIWIAEADDSCDDLFLEKVLPAFSDSNVKLSYSESRAIDADSNCLFQYQDMQYLKELSESKWRTSYVVEARCEVETALAFRNTIPNVSAVVFRKFDCSGWFEVAKDMKLAGDWLFYLHAIMGGSLSYVPEPLNYHRRHEDTCTASTENSTVRFEEIVMVQNAACSFYDLHPDVASSCKLFAQRVWLELGLDADDFDDHYACLLN